MTEYTYEIIESITGSSIIKRTSSNGVECWIPIDGNNSDYQAYLESLNDNSEAE
jgi:hypothetical protein